MESKRIFNGKHDELQSRLVSDFIGNTPFVRLSDKIYAKLESVNPGGSIKDRPVKWILDDAEENKLIKPGDTIIEATSGNTGIALAMIAAERGYKVKIVMPCDMSEERKVLLRMYGAELIEVDKGDFDEAIRMSDRIFMMTNKIGGDIVSEIDNQTTFTADNTEEAIALQRSRITSLWHQHMDTNVTN